MTSTIRLVPLALTLTLCLALLLLTGPSKPVGAATAPTGFTDTKVASVGAPTAVAFTPDGRMLVTTQQGRLNVYRDGTLLKDGALNLGSRVCANSERGLLGLAVDPEFESNRYVYVYYTHNKFGQTSNSCATKRDGAAVNTPVNRASRFQLSDANVASGETVLVDGMPSPAGNHNAGDLHFGKDGYLYISVGDGGCDYAIGTAFSGCAGANDAARDTNVLLGKILRVTRDGGIPADNPYASYDRCGEPGGDGRTSAGRLCRETYASGLRNPFRFAIDPDASGTRFFVNDVGQGKWEEIDEGKAAANYGWNYREGFCANNQTTGCRTTPNATVGGLTDPVHAYGRSVGTSITGGAFVPDGVWPAGYDSSYLFGDFVSGKVFRLTPNGSGTNTGYARSEFITGLGGSSAVAMAFGPYEGTQALYYTTYAGGGEVRRVAYTAAPTASVTADPTYGASLPLAVEFDGSGSRGAGALAYLWDFDGDGTINKTTTTPTVTHEYTTEGTYTATLKVRDANGKESQASEVEVYPGNTPPAPKIEAPASDGLFRVGEAITLRGSATDAEDDAAVSASALPDSSLHWEVLRHHNNSHTHPWFSGTGNNLTFPTPPPEDLSATGPGNYLEVRLTATDSWGLKRTVSQSLIPRRVNVTLSASPASVGLDLGVNGTAVAAPRTITSWDGYGLNLNAFGQKDRYGRYVRFYRWSDGGAASHAVTTPSYAVTRTASFRFVTGLALSARDRTLDRRDRARLVGRLRTTNGAPVAGKPVSVWRSVDGGRSWRRIGRAGYDRSEKTYQFTTPRLARNSLFQARFYGDSSYTPDTSRVVGVRVRR